MLVQERKAHLLRLLGSTGRVVAKTVAADLKVSEDTIRRDLRELAADGQLKRVHGGAVPNAPAEAPFAGRIPIANAEKVAIGRHAAGMIEPGQTVFLDGGTTALQVARHIAPDLRATILTHSPNVAMALMVHPNLEIEIIGGRLFRHSVVTVGARVLTEIGRLKPTLAFVGATGLSVEGGISTGDREESEVKRAIIRRARAAYILASSEKIGVASPFEVCGLDEVAGAIVSKDTKGKDRKALERAGCACLLASG